MILDVCTHKHLRLKTNMKQNDDILSPHPQVGRTLSCLGAAGVAVWVLTGDKKETALNISYSCGHLTQVLLHTSPLLGAPPHLTPSPLPGHDGAGPDWAGGPQGGGEAADLHRPHQPQGGAVGPGGAASPYPKLHFLLDFIHLIPFTWFFAHSFLGKV